MVLLRLVWGWSVHRQLESQLTAIRLRGEPINASQIIYESIPDADNAVTIYREAIKALSEGSDSPRNSNLEYSDNFPPSPQWMALAEASEKAHARVFALARAARQRPRAQLANSLAEVADLRYLGELKAMANTICDGAEYSHLRGNDVEAIERIRDVLHISRTLRSDDYPVSYLVSVGVDALVCHSLELMGPDLAVKEVNIRPLINQLLDEDAQRFALRQALIIERIRQIRWYEEKAARDWFLGPLAERDLIRELPSFELFLRACEAKSSPQAEEILDHCQWPSQQWMWSFGSSYNGFVPRYSRWFYWGNVIESREWFNRFYRVLAERRLTAVTLACQLYRAEHGHFPQSLDQLVPAYLPAIPRDPFFSDDRRIGYVIKTHAPPLSGPRPLLYFDPGGGDVAPQAEPLYDWYGPASGVRQYRDLSRFAPPSSPKTINNQPDKADAPGQDSQK